MPKHSAVTTFRAVPVGVHKRKSPSRHKGGAKSKKKGGGRRRKGGAHQSSGWMPLTGALTVGAVAKALLGKKLPDVIVPEAFSVWLLGEYTKKGGDKQFAYALQASGLAKPVVMKGVAAVAKAMGLKINMDGGNALPSTNADLAGLLKSVTGADDNTIGNVMQELPAFAEAQ